MVQAHAHGYLRVRQTEKSDTLPEIKLSSGITSNSYQVATDETLTFYLDVEKPSVVKCELLGSNGGLDLGISWHKPDQYECMTSGLTDMLSCTMGFGEGRAYASVYGYANTSNFAITCTAIEVSFTELTSGVKTGPYDIVTDGSLFFSMDVAELSTILCEIDGSSGELNLKMQWSKISEYGCFAGGDSYGLKCLAGPATGRVFITLHSYDSATNVNIQCTVNSSIEANQKMLNVAIR